MDLIDIIESRRFLGGEFLTWLWSQCDQHQGRFSLPEYGVVEIAMDDQLVLEAYLAETERSRLTGGAPSDSPEAKTALRSGKRVAKAKMRLGYQGREWVFSADATQFTFSSVKVPAVLKEPDERLLERLSLIDELSDIWRALYRTFLTDRLGERWEQVENEMSEWIKADDWA